MDQEGANLGRHHLELWRKSIASVIYYEEETYRSVDIMLLKSILTIH
jgi:hypothetical protein